MTIPQPTTPRANAPPTVLAVGVLLYRAIQNPNRTEYLYPVRRRVGALPITALGAPKKLPLSGLASVALAALAVWDFVFRMAAYSAAQVRWDEKTDTRLESAFADFTLDFAHGWLWVLVFIGVWVAAAATFSQWTPREDVRLPAEPAGVPPSASAVTVMDPPAVKLAPHVWPRVLLARALEGPLFLPVAYVLMDPFVCAFSEGGSRFSTSDCASATECFNGSHYTAVTFAVVAIAILLVSFGGYSREPWNQHTVLGLGLPHLMCGALVARLTLAWATKVLRFYSPCYFLAVAVLANFAITFQLVLALDSRRLDAHPALLTFLVAVEVLITFFGIYALCVLGSFQDDSPGRTGDSCAWVAGAFLIIAAAYLGYLLWRRHATGSRKPLATASQPLTSTPDEATLTPVGPRPHTTPGWPIITAHPQSVEAPLGSSFTLRVEAHMSSKATSTAATSTAAAITATAAAPSPQGSPSDAVIPIGPAGAFPPSPSPGASGGVDAAGMWTPTGHAVRPAWGTGAAESKAAADGGLRYQWLLDDEPLEGATKPWLTVNDVSVDDYGEYACNVVSAAGRARSDPAVVTRGGAPPIVLHASPMGAGPHTYQWYKHTEALAGATQSTLTVSDYAHVSDLVAYACRVTHPGQHSHGTLTEAAEVLVGVPVVLQPAPGAGGRLTDTRWYRNSVQYAPRNPKQVFVPANTAVSDVADVYTVDVRTTTTHRDDWVYSVPLAVSAVQVDSPPLGPEVDNSAPPPPTFASTATATTAAPSEDRRTLVVLAGAEQGAVPTSPGTNTPYTWRDSNGVIAGHTQGLLELEVPASLDALLGLRVDGGRVCLLSPVTLSAELPDWVDPPVTYAWVDTMQGNHLSSRDHLWVPRMPVSQLATYECRVTTASRGADQHPKATIIVYPSTADGRSSHTSSPLGVRMASPTPLPVPSPPPQHSAPSPPRHPAPSPPMQPVSHVPVAVPLGGAVTLRAVSEPTPGDSFQWYLGDRVLAGETSNTLTLRGITPEHLGAYQCVVVDRHGSTSTIVTAVTGEQRPPTIVRQPASVEVPLDVSSGGATTTTLRVDVAPGAYPPPTFQWFRDSASLGAVAQGNTLVVDVVEGEGWYTCEVSGGGGHVVTSEPAHVSGVMPTDALPAFQPRVLEQRMESLRVGWEAPPLAGLHPLEYRVSVQEHHAETSVVAAQEDSTMLDMSVATELEHHVEHHIVRDGSTTFLFDEFRGEPVNPADGFVFTVSTRTQDGAQAGPALASASRGGAGGLWGAVAGGEGWTEEDDDAAWNGECVPLVAHTAGLPPGERVVVLGGRFPRLFMANPLIFDTNKATLRDNHVGDLNLVAAILRAKPGLRVTVEGHVNFCKTPEAADKLSEKRAATVVDALVGLGVSQACVTPRGYGQRRTKYPKGSLLSFRNKRVDFVITAGL